MSHLLHRKDVLGCSEEGMLRQPARSSTQVQVLEGRLVWSSAHGRVKGQLWSAPHVLAGGRCGGVAARRRAPGATVTVAMTIATSPPGLPKGLGAQCRI
jgi:hypothetical protein